MGITITAPQPGRSGWLINGVSADASGCEELKAAPGTSLSIIVDHVTINNGANVLSITIGQGVNAGSVEKALLGPIAMAANTSLQFWFPFGMLLDANKSLTVDASGAGAICVFVRGRTQ